MAKKRGRKDGLTLNSEEIGQLQSELDRRGWNQANLAEETGLSKNPISRLLSSGKTSLGTLATVSEKLAVPMPRFFPQLEFEFEITSELIEDAAGWLEARPDRLILRGTLHRGHRIRAGRRLVVTTLAR